MANVALADLILPYVLRAENLGATHAALTVLRVVTFETADDINGTVIRGTCEINGTAAFTLTSFQFNVNEAAPAYDPQRRDPIIDLQETSIDFELFVPRVGSPIVSQATIPANVLPVLNVWDTLPLDQPTSSYPATGFTLDLILKAPTFRPPGLTPARMTERGLLVPLNDPAVREVTFTLPTMRFRLTHANQLSFFLVSAGVAGLDDPGDTGVAELVSMTPPYALIGRPSGLTVGFGFRKAVLDLSDASTPPAVLEKFGFGDDWQGLYLPEVRFFVAPSGTSDFAFQVGARDLLIGFGAHAGISGDFEAGIINQGTGTLDISTRFFGAGGTAYGIARESATRATAVVPAATRMVVDIQGGLAPYTTTVTLDGTTLGSGVAFDITLPNPTATIDIQISDSAPTPRTARLAIALTRRAPAEVLVLPGTAPNGGGNPNSPRPTLTPGGADQLKVVLANSTPTAVVLQTDPPENVYWTVVGEGAEVGPQLSLTVPLAAGETKTVRARKPGQTVPTALDYFYYFDRPLVPSGSNADSELGDYASMGDKLWTTAAVSELEADGRLPGGRDPNQAYGDTYQTIVPVQSPITIIGDASNEGNPAKLRYNYLLANRRAVALREYLQRKHSNRHFDFQIDPPNANPSDADLSAFGARWNQPDHLVNRNQFWRATVQLPANLNQPERQAEVTVNRPPVPAQPPIVPRDEPPVQEPAKPDFFRSAVLRARFLQNDLIALEVEIEVDFDTAAEQLLRKNGGLGQAVPRTQVSSLQNGTPVGPDNPADGITKLRMLGQVDDATGQITFLMQIGADPADKDGLLYGGWVPGIQRPADKDAALTLLGSYLTFWPLFVAATKSNNGAIVDAALVGAALALPAGIASLDWFRVERVILFGGEYLQRDRGDTFESYLLFDVRVDWSAQVAFITISPDQPLQVRYKAIGLRFGNSTDLAGPQGPFQLRPVFDASRGYSIDLQSGGGIQVAPPFDKILKILAARISRTNPLMFEVDLGFAVDLGVVTIDRTRLRIELASPPKFEITALGAKVDIPGALVGQGFVEIKDAGIAGQIDLTLVPIQLRIAASIAVQHITDNGRDLTAVFVGLNVVLPVGIPLGASGLGLFGFRGIFGMHYARNSNLGSGTANPSLGWLAASKGQPHLLQVDGNTLWVPKADQWVFGIGALLGTMEGGVILNLDGTLLLELPGPRIVIVLNARLLQPPPGVGGVGQSGGILAILEITPEHILIGIIVDYEIKNLVRIRIPIEAYFDFVKLSNWHLWLGRRDDPIVIDVLGIIRGTGYFMIQGNGLAAYKGLPEVQGFGLALGFGVSFVWGDEDVGLYLKIGGSLDVVLGFDPFVLGGLLEIHGELRLFIISIGAHASLTLIVREVNQGNGTDIQTYVHGEVCGHVDFFFFEVEGCVDVTIGSLAAEPPLPKLVSKMALQSRSPALLLGSGADRPIDASLGDALEKAAPPTPEELNGLVAVPIDSVPLISFIMPVQSTNLQFLGSAANVSGSSGLGDGDVYAPRGSELYRFTVASVTLERLGQPTENTLLGSETPATWILQQAPNEPNPNVQLALLSYEPQAVTKAIEKSDVLTESVTDRWGTVCQEVAPPASTLWTFRYEKLGPSLTGWELEGITWPDPAGTIRSQAPDTKLGVNEPWRTGVQSVDSARGILAAVVTGEMIRCASDPDATTAVTIQVGGRGPISPTDPTGTVLASNSSAAARLARVRPKIPYRITNRLLGKVTDWQPLSALPSDPIAILSRLKQGQAVARQELLQTFRNGGTIRTATNDALKCEARLLQSPIFDDGRIIVIGDPAQEAAIKKKLESAKVVHGPLDNVVELQTGAFADGRLLLFIQRELLANKQVAVRALTEAGDELYVIQPTPADRVPPRALPARWTNKSGPWADDIADLIRWGEDRKSGHVAVLVRLPGSEKIARVQIGQTPAPPPKQLNPAYYVGALEFVSEREVRRHDSDSSELDKQRTSITKVTTGDPTSKALLYPDSVYKVTVNWSGLRKGSSVTATEAQAFWFKTDSAPPLALDQWVTLTTPAEGETHVFGGEPARIIFNTADIDRLYAAYGKQLRIRFQASSSNHPQPTATVPHPLPISKPWLKPAGAGILSPWEEVLTEVLDGQCIPIDEGRTRQTTVEIPIPLDAYTDYLMDVELVDVGAADNATGTRVYRRGFSTGGHANLQSLANSFIGQIDAHRVGKGDVLNQFRTQLNGRAAGGAEFDDALRAAGIDARPRPSIPRVEIIWDQTGAAVPQPVAILIEAGDPFHRVRPHPAKVTDESGPVKTERWVLGSRVWLEVVPSAASSGFVAPQGAILGPTGDQLLLVLAAGARGQQVTLELHLVGLDEPYLKIPDQRIPIVDVLLDRAPWEE